MGRGFRRACFCGTDRLTASAATRKHTPRSDINGAAAAACRQLLSSKAPLSCAAVQVIFLHHLVLPPSLSMYLEIQILQVLSDIADFTCMMHHPMVVTSAFATVSSNFVTLVRQLLLSHHTLLTCCAVSIFVQQTSSVRLCELRNPENSKNDASLGQKS